MFIDKKNDYVSKENHVYFHLYKIKRIYPHNYFAQKQNFWRYTPNLLLGTKTQKRRFLLFYLCLFVWVFSKQDFCFQPQRINGCGNCPPRNKKKLKNTLEHWILDIRKGRAKDCNPWKKGNVWGYLQNCPSLLPE